MDATSFKLHTEDGLYMGDVDKLDSQIVTNSRVSNWQNKAKINIMLVKEIDCTHKVASKKLRLFMRFTVLRDGYLVTFAMLLSLQQSEAGNYL